MFSLPSLAGQFLFPPFFCSHTPRSFTCLAHSAPRFHFAFLSTPSSIHFSCAANCSTTGKERTLILHTAPWNSACWILQLWSFLKLPVRETGRAECRPANAYTQKVTDMHVDKCTALRTQNPRSTTVMLETKLFAFTQLLLCVSVCGCAFEIMCSV